MTLRPSLRWCGIGIDDRTSTQDEAVVWASYSYHHIVGVTIVVGEVSRETNVLILVTQSRYLTQDL